MNRNLLCIILVLLVTSNVTLANEEFIYEIDGESYTLEEPITIVLNGKIIELEEPALIYKSRTIVPMKFLFNELGYDVSWQAETRTVTAIRGKEEIKLQIENKEILINSETITSDVKPVIINNRTYIPLNLVTTGSGAKVEWLEETRTVSVEKKLDELNVFYGRSSISNYTKLFESEKLGQVDSIGYAWSRIEFNQGEVILNTTSLGDNLMYYPQGHEYVTKDIIKTKLLNVYCDSNYENIFAQKDELIKEITNSILKPRSDDPKFDGVIIDFEVMNSKHFEDYLDFIKRLKVELEKNNKVLHVAIQARNSYSYDELIKHVDRLILMLHDYESKDGVIFNYSKNYVEQAITPIEKVESDLELILNQIDTYSEKSKIVLQLNLAVVQWQGEEGFESKRYTPSYSKLIERMEKLTSNDFFFDEKSKNPYLYYTDEDNLVNTVWYENEESIQAKIDLVYKYKLAGLSIWQLANIPFSETVDLKEYELELWEKIIENY